MSHQKDIEASAWLHLKSIPDGEDILIRTGHDPQDVVEEAVAGSGSMNLVAHLKLDRKIRTERAKLAESGALRKSQRDIKRQTRAQPLRSLRCRGAIEDIKREPFYRKNYALTALSWLIHAEEPLSSGDFAAALRTDLENSTSTPVKIWGDGTEIWIEPQTASTTLHATKTSAMRLSELCRGLVSITDGPLVTLSDDFDISPEDRKRLFPDAYRSIAEVCLRVLRDDIPSLVAERHDRPAARRGVESWTPLTAYAQKHWVTHLKPCKNEVLHSLAADFLFDLYKSGLEMPSFEKRQSISYGEHQVVVIDVETPVLKAARLGLDGALELLLSSKLHDVNAVSYKKETAISAAVQAGHTSTVQLVVRHGASIHYRDQHGESLLHMAAAANDEIMIALLISLGLDKNTRARRENMSHGTALHVAVNKGSFEAAKMLLRYRIDMYTEDCGETAMDVATRNGNREMEELLARHGYEFDSASVGQSNRPEAAKPILDHHEADTQARASAVATTSGLAVTEDGQSRTNTSLRDAGYLGDMQFVERPRQPRQIVDRVYSSTSSAPTPVQWGKCPPAGAMVEMRSNLLRAQLWRHWEPIHDAAMLHRRNADNITADGNEGLTCLAAAALSGSDDIVSQLLCRSHQVLSSQDYLRLLNACSYRHQAFEVVGNKHGIRRRERALPSVTSLERIGQLTSANDELLGVERSNILASACYANAPEIVSLALRKGASLPERLHFRSNARPSGSRNPLHHVIVNGFVDVATALLTDPRRMPNRILSPVAVGPAKANLIALDDRGRNGLHLACLPLLSETGSLIPNRNSKAKEIILSTILLTSGTSLVNSRVLDSGNTPLHLAVTTRHPKLGSILLDHGASVDIRNYQGRTPLHEAMSMFPCVLIVKLLLEAGACPSATDLAGNTPCHLVKDESRAGGKAVDTVVRYYDSHSEDSNKHGGLHGSTG